MTTYTDERKISSVQTDTAIFYPETDGKPMAATDFHRRILIRTLHTLEAHFEQQPDVYVSGDLLMYYVEGDPYQVVAPDVLVSFGLDKKDRDTYLVWVEGKTPDFVMEFSSKTTYDEDLGPKKELYASLGIQDYILYDAESLFLPSPLMGYTLVDGEYVPISDDGEGGLHSVVLGLDLHVADVGLGLYDPVAGAWLQTPAESAEARAEHEAGRADNAEARAEHEAGRADNAEARAEHEAGRADNAEARAEHEAGRAKAAEAEIAQLRQQLERLQSPK